MENFFYQLVALIKNHPLLGYIFAIINSFLQIFFPPYPGDTFIAVLGYLSSLKIINSTLLLIIILLSTIISSIMLFLLSYYFSENIKNSKYINKYFKLSNIEKFNKWYENYGPFAIIISKFLPGVNSIVLISSGLLKLNKSFAIFSIIISSILHNGMLFIAGRITGYNIKQLNIMIKEYSFTILFSLIIILLLFKLLKGLLRNFTE